MKPVDHITRQRALVILSASFIGNPNVKRVIRKDRYAERVGHLCRYCLDAAMLRHGAYITSDAAGVLLMYPDDARISTLAEIRLSLRLIWLAVGWWRVPLILFQQARIKKLRSTYKHLYIHMMAVDHNRNGLQTVVEMKDFIFKKSKKHGLPVLAETSVMKNRRVYERYGFRTYAKMEPSGNFTLWFLQRSNPSPAA